MSVSIQDFGKSTSGQTVKLATLKNDFIEVQLLSYAAIIHRIIVKDRKGNPVDVVLGYDTAADYELNTDSMGAAVGRFANRIAGAQFPLYEEIVHITPNQNGNCLHSGLHGFNHTMFDVALTPGETDSVTMTATSPAGTDGFPGNFDLTIQYSLAKSGLVIRYGATTDAPTVCNMTNHSYFNLNGHASGSALGHRVTVDADFYLEADAASIPTGRKLPVKGTPMDFTEEKTLGLDIGADFTPLTDCCGQQDDHAPAILGGGAGHHKAVSAVVALAADDEQRPAQRKVRPQLGVGGQPGVFHHLQIGQAVGVACTLDLLHLRSGHNAVLHNLCLPLSRYDIL